MYFQTPLFVLYITIHITAIEEEDKNIYALMMQQQASQMNQQQQ